MSEGRWLASWSELDSGDDYVAELGSDGSWAAPIALGYGGSQRPFLVDGELHQIHRVPGLVSSHPEAFGTSHQVAHSRYVEGAWTDSFLIDDAGKGASLIATYQQGADLFITGNEGGEVYWTSVYLRGTCSKPFYLTDPLSSSFLSPTLGDLAGLWAEDQRPLLATTDTDGFWLWSFD